MQKVFLFVAIDVKPGKFDQFVSAANADSSQGNSISEENANLQNFQQSDVQDTAPT